MSLYDEPAAEMPVVRQIDLGRAEDVQAITGGAPVSTGPARPDVVSLAATNDGKTSPVDMIRSILDERSRTR